MAYNAVSLTIGVPLLAVFSRLMGEPWTLPTTASTWAAYIYLVLIGSVVVFYLFLYVLSRWTASTTSYLFLLIPISTAIFGTLLVGEAITLTFVIGAVMVVAGVWVGAFHRKPQAPEKAELACAGLPDGVAC